MSSRTVHDAVLTRLRAVLDPVHDGYVPKGPDGRPVDERFAVLYSAAPLRSADDLARTHDVGDHAWRVVSVGSSPEQVLDVAATCSAALAGQRLDVQGVVCDLIEQTSASPVRVDEDMPAGPPVHYCSDAFTARTIG